MTYIDKIIIGIVREKDFKLLYKKDLSVHYIRTSVSKSNGIKYFMSNRHKIFY